MQYEKEESSANKCFYMEKVIFYLILRPALMNKFNS